MPLGRGLFAAALSWRRDDAGLRGSHDPRRHESLYVVQCVIEAVPGLETAAQEEARDEGQRCDVRARGDHLVQGYGLGGSKAHARSTRQRSPGGR